jgi:hypothetical protein
VGGGKTLVCAGELISKAEVDYRYGDDDLTAPNVFGINETEAYYDCTFVRGAITYSNTAPAGETNAEISPTNPIPSLLSCALRSTTAIEFGGSVVVDYGEEYTKKPPTPLTRHGSFPALQCVRTLYRFSEAPVEPFGVVADRNGEGVGWPSSLEQREVVDHKGLAEFVKLEL